MHDEFYIRVLFRPNTVIEMGEVHLARLLPPKERMHFPCNCADCLPHNRYQEVKYVAVVSHTYITDHEAIILLDQDEAKMVVI